MDRKLIRPTLTAHPAAGHRKAVAPESTHAEAGYLLHAIESGAPFVVELLGGEVVRGRLEAHDRDVLVLAQEGGGALILRKERIRCYHAERRPAETAP